MIEQLCGEVWKEITQNKAYSISNYGRIKRKYKTTEERLLKPYKNKGGYLRVDILTEGKRKTYLVHRLVAQEFVEAGSPEQNTVDHIDGDKTNNRADNLQYLSRKENVQKAIEMRKKGC